MNKAPAYQTFANDELAATVFLSNEALGVYTRLKHYFWVKDGLPNDTAKLAKLCQMPESAFIEIWETEVKDFFAFDDEKLYHSDLISQADFQADKREKATKAVNKRWNNAGKTDEPVTDTNEHTNEDTDVLPTKYTSTSTSTSKRIERESARETPVNGEIADEIESYFSEIRKILKTKSTTLPNEPRWLQTVLTASKEQLPPAAVATSLKELLAQKRDYPVTPENVINHAIERRAKADTQKSDNGFLPKIPPKSKFLSDNWQGRSN